MFPIRFTFGGLDAILQVHGEYSIVGSRHGATVYTTGGSISGAGSILIGDNVSSVLVDRLNVSFNDGGTGLFAVGIDNVQLTAAVPEASTAALLLAGLGLIAPLVRRRRMPGR